MAKRRVGSDTRSIGHVKARFAEYIRAAEAGTATVLTRHGRPVARLMPYRPEAATDPAAPAGEVREPGRVSEASLDESFQSTDARRVQLRRLLENEIRSRVPADMRGKGVSKREREEILGYRESGV